MAALDAPCMIGMSDTGATSVQHTAVRDLEMMLADKTFEVVALQGVVAEQEVRIAELEDQKASVLDCNREIVYVESENESVTMLKTDVSRLHDEVAKLNDRLITSQAAETGATSAKNNAFVQLSASELKVAELESALAEKNMVYSQLQDNYNKVLAERVLAQQQQQQDAAKYAEDAILKSQRAEVVTLGSPSTTAGTRSIHVQSPATTVDSDAGLRSLDLASIRDEIFSIGERVVATARSISADAQLRTPRSIAFDGCGDECQRRRSGSRERSLPKVTSDVPLINFSHESEAHEQSTTIAHRQVRAVSPYRIVAPLRSVDGDPLLYTRGRIELDAPQQRGRVAPSVVVRRTAVVSAAAPIPKVFHSVSPTRTRCVSPMQAWRSIQKANVTTTRLSPKVRWLAPSPVRTLRPMTEAQLRTASSPHRAPKSRTLWTEVRAASPLRTDKRYEHAAPAMATSSIRIAASPVRTTFATSLARSISPIRALQSVSPLRTPITTPVSSPVIASRVIGQIVTACGQPRKDIKSLWMEMRAERLASSRPLDSFLLPADHAATQLMAPAYQIPAVLAEKVAPGPSAQTEAMNSARGSNRTLTPDGSRDQRCTNTDKAGAARAERCF